MIGQVASTIINGLFPGVGSTRTATSKQATPNPVDLSDANRGVAERLANVQRFVMPNSPISNHSL